MKAVLSELEIAALCGGKKAAQRLGEQSPLKLLEAICSEIYERWDKDMRSGKLLQALAGELPNYRADVTAVRAALSRSPQEAETP